VQGIGKAKLIYAKNAERSRNTKLLEMNYGNKPRIVALLYLMTNDIEERPLKKKTTTMFRPRPSCNFSRN
jgi:hypothetical protein